MNEKGLGFSNDANNCWYIFLNEKGCQIHYSYDIYKLYLWIGIIYKFCLENVLI